jgi:hypothetical protein
VNNLYKIWTYEILYTILLSNLLIFQVYYSDIFQRILTKLNLHFMKFLRFSMNFGILSEFLEYLTNNEFEKR